MTSEWDRIHDVDDYTVEPRPLRAHDNYTMVPNNADDTAYNTIINDLDTSPWSQSQADHSAYTTASGSYNPPWSAFRILSPNSESPMLYSAHGAQDSQFEETSESTLAVPYSFQAYEPIYNSHARPAHLGLEQRPSPTFQSSSFSNWCEQTNPPFYEPLDEVVNLNSQPQYSNSAELRYSEPWSTLNNRHEAASWGYNPQFQASFDIVEAPDMLNLGGLNTPTLVAPPMSTRMSTPESNGSIFEYALSLHADDAEVLSCPDCSSQFTGTYRRGNLARHKRNHRLSGREHTCVVDGCARVFTRKDARLKHYRKHHSALAVAGPYVSRVPRTSRSSGNDHTAIDIQGSETSSMYTSGSRDFADYENPAKCDICHAVFGRAAELRRHMLGHQPESYYCEVPGCYRKTGFSRKDKLHDHVRRMHKDKANTEDDGTLKIAEHPCTELGCGRIFDHRADLLRHERTHLAPPEKPYKCSTCNQTFLYPKDLRRHEKTHEDGPEQEFFCTVASCTHKGGFSRKDALTRHIRNYHADTLVE